jgi:GAF domain-containing protein
MQHGLRNLFAPAVFPADDDKTRSARHFNSIGWSTLLTLIGILIVRILQNRDVSLDQINGALLGVIVLIGISLILARRGYIRIASFVLIVTIWSGLTYLAWVADGIRDVAFFAYTVPIMIASLLLGWRGGAIVTLLSIASGWTLAYAEANQIFVPSLDDPLSFARDMTGVFVLIAIIIYLAIGSLQDALHQARSAMQELSTSLSELNALRVELEQRVEDRTSELSRRASQLEAVASVARTIAFVQDLDVLLPTITRLVSQRFGFYHVGIFLLDAQRKYAVLRAANSAGGQRMLDRQHQLPLDEHSIVGYAMSRGEARVALDVGTDSVHFNNPDLPETRSEMAIPLRVAGKVIGALDVQSTEINAFSEEDVNVLSTLADQIAIAIENARLFSETKKALEDAQLTFERYAQREWRSFVRQVKQRGYIFDGKHVLPLDPNVRRESVQAALQTGRLSLEKASTTIAVPLKLRGQTIGVLDVRSKNGQRQWRQDEIAMLEAAAERAALALENARLVESAQRRAARERAIGDISGKIGSVSSVESILQTAVEELGRKIGGATEVTLEIDTGDEHDYE